MNGIFSFVVNIIGIIFGLVFIGLNIKAGRSLVGSFFKNYYRWMVVGALIFTLGFSAEFIKFFGVTENIADGIHHLLLMIAVIIFVITSLTLPKEASQYMKSQNL